MTFDPSAFRPKVASWVKTIFTHTGHGRAEFTQPRGWIEGSATVEVDEAGEVTIVMEIEDFDCEVSIESDRREDNLMWLLSGRKPQKEGDWVVGVGGIQPLNNCSTLTVQTPDGFFRPIGDITYREPFIGWHDKIYFFCTLSYFEADDFNEPIYWNMALTNFVSKLGIRHPILGPHPLDQHPLRLMSILPIPDSVTDAEARARAYMIANGGNGIIPFGYENEFGFIELLPDYEDWAEKLLSGGATTAITGIMVGSIGSHSSSVDKARDWIPFDFLHL